MYQLVEKSNNKKTGPISIITTTPDTCPQSCPLRRLNLCYAAYGPIWYKWQKTMKRGYDINVLEEKLHQLTKGTIIRFADAGDLPGDGTLLNKEECLRLSKIVSDKKLKVFTFTHYDLNIRPNLKVVRDMISNGFVANVSTTHPDEAVHFFKKKLPVALAVGFAPYQPRYEGVRFRKCYTETEKPHTMCLTCGNGKQWCRQAERDFMVTFTAHGSKKGRMDKFLREEARGTGFYKGDLWN